MNNQFNNMIDNISIIQNISYVVKKKEPSTALSCQHRATSVSASEHLYKGSQESNLASGTTSI